MVTFPYGSRVVDEAPGTGVIEEALVGPAGSGGTGGGVLEDRPTSPLVIGFEAEVGEALETRGQSLMRAKCDPFSRGGFPEGMTGLHRIIQGCFQLSD